MNDMVSRVAAALAPFFSGADRAYGEHVDAARAAIEAMRDPPFAVLLAMMNTIDDDGGDLHARKWAAAIDAALRPLPEGE